MVNLAQDGASLVGGASRGSRQPLSFGPSEVKAINKKLVWHAKGNGEMISLAQASLVGDNDRGSRHALRWDYSTFLFPSGNQITEKDNLENLWSFETIGIENRESHLSNDQALEHFRRTIYRESSGRYVVKLPWKDRKTPLPTDYRMAVARLKSVLERSSEEKLVEVHQVILDQLKDNIVEDIPFQPRNQSNVNQDEVKRVH